MKTWLKWMGAGVAAMAVAAGIVTAGTVGALRAAPGEWSVPLHLAGWRFDASAPTLIRWAVHPLVRSSLDGRVLTTRAGRWTLHARADGAIEADCTPCIVRLGALGNAPLAMVGARFVVHPRGADRFDGTLHLATPGEPVVLPWQATLRADALTFRARLEATPIRRAIAVLADAPPEMRQAEVSGEMSLALTASVSARGFSIDRITPVLTGVNVRGLGTETLADADVRGRCRPQPQGGRVEGWIQNAVIAAEDQRFMQHPGYEVDAWVAAWRRNAAQDAGEALQGASTITMQLAKLLYTGDERSATRKLREWLYAVEMERTLGKGRILQLYLAVLPWGDGVCGAEAAARHHLGKSVNQLKPREAAWLASLLINPDRQLRRWSSDEAGARARVAAVLHGIRRLPAERRESELEALASWQPPVSRSAEVR
jgi:hypothetical protein